MKITKLEILKVPPSWVWIKIHTDVGITGLGEPYLENHADSVIAEVHRLEQFLIGEDPTRIEYLWERMYASGSGYKGGPIKMSAISGIDIALWDITGKAAGVPIYQLLGGKTRDRVKMYRATGGGLPHIIQPGEPYRTGYAGKPAADRHDPAVWAEGARILTQEWGFRALKVHFGPGEGLEITSRVEHFGELFAAVRAGAGPDVDVAVDIHNPHPAIANQMIEVLAPHRPRTP